MKKVKRTRARARAKTGMRSRRGLKKATTQTHRRRAGRARKQPRPVTPGVTAGMVRQHAFEMYRDKLPGEPLTTENWVIAEKDLVDTMDEDDILKR